MDPFSQFFQQNNSFNNGSFNQQQNNPNINLQNIPKSNKDSQILEAESNPKSGHYHKKIGNDYFAKKLYKEAIQSYSKAIELNGNEAIFYMNRARAYKLIKDFSKAYKDAIDALEIDDMNIKAYVLCGQILAEIGKNERKIEKITIAVNRFKKALNLAKEQKNHAFDKDINIYIRRCKKAIAILNSEIGQQKKQNIVSFITGFIQKDSNFSEDEKIIKEAEISNYIPTIISNEEPPDWFCCKITMDLMSEPTMTSVGTSYDKHSLMLHLEKNNYDPVSREVIQKSQCIPNVNLSLAIEDYLENHPIAYESFKGDDLSTVDF